MDDYFIETLWSLPPGVELEATEEPPTEAAEEFGPDDVFLPAIGWDALVAMTTSGFTAAAFQFAKTWIDARNGRKLKIKVGDIEVEATQMKERTCCGFLSCSKKMQTERKFARSC